MLDAINPYKFLFKFYINQKISLVEFKLEFVHWLTIFMILFLKNEKPI